MGMFLMFKMYILIGLFNISKRDSFFICSKNKKFSRQK